MTQSTFETATHRTSFIDVGPRDGPLLIFVHGWPQVGAGWRHQLQCFGNLGFRCVAPDLRGYGESTVYREHEAYAQSHVVADLVALLAHLGRASAVWIGHDWGAATVWNVAAHHPDAVAAVAGLSVPYRTVERGPQAILPLVDRAIYPIDRYPWGQWEYQRFYQERFERATGVFDADIESTMIALHRRGNPATEGLPTFHADIFAQNGWFGGRDVAPTGERDPAVLDEADLKLLVDAFSRTGFFGADAYYMNEAANLAYSDEAANGGRLHMPALFIAGRYDATCESIRSRLAEPMREYCDDLTEASVDTGHWLHQEQPALVNAIIARWLIESVPQVWPTGRSACVTTGADAAGALS